MISQMKIWPAVAAALGLFVVVWTVSRSARPGPLTAYGYVLDSACAFTKDLRKPISPECATACAKAGSPLVILTDDGRVLWPIDKETPAVGQNSRLLPFAGKKVIVKGEAFERGGSRAIVIESIESERASQ